MFPVRLNTVHALQSEDVSFENDVDVEGDPQVLGGWHCGQAGPQFDVLEGT